MHTVELELDTSTHTITDLTPDIRAFCHDDRYHHAHGSRGHGADHLLPALLSPSLVLPVVGGEPALGVWQSVAFVDTNRDNPTRHVRLTFLAST